MELKKIIIVGSNVQSWVCAYILKTQLPFLDVQIINQPIEDDNEIDVGTFTLTKKLLEFIDVKDFFQETKGLINVGKRYNNWNKEKEVFTCNNSFNGLKIDEITWPWKDDTDENENQLDPENEILLFNAAFKRAYLNHLLTDTSISFSEFTSLFDSDMLPDIPLDKMIDLFENPNRAIGITYKTAYLLEYFKKIARQQEVVVIDDFFVSVEQAEDETIISINGEKGNYLCDFVLDCTGTYRNVISNFSFYNFWLNPSIEADCALRFELDGTKGKIWKDLYAMENGYLIEISMQDTTSYAYVFNQSYATVDQILLEIQTYLKIPDIGKYTVVNLNCGCVDKAIIKNCLVLGSTAGSIDPIFIDPTELLIKELDSFITLLIENDDDSDPNLISIPDETIMLKTLEYNETFSNFFKEISDLSILYTWTNLRTEKGYWTACSSSYNVSSTEIVTGIEETMSFKVNYWRYFHLYYNTENSLFSFLNEYDFLVALRGNRIYNFIDRKKIIQNNDILDFCSTENYYRYNDNFQQFMNNLLSNGITALEYQKKYEFTSEK